MPQELFVVQCYSCDTFQVQIVKKVPKWQCKMCGKKQSVKKVFGRGTGKECREYVQEMNKKRLEEDESPKLEESPNRADLSDNNSAENAENKENNCEKPLEGSKRNKWLKYMEENVENLEGAVCKKRKLDNN